MTKSFGYAAQTKTSALEPSSFERRAVGADDVLIYVNKLEEAYERTVKADVRYRFVIDIASLKAKETQN